MTAVRGNMRSLLVLICAVLVPLAFMHALPHPPAEQPRSAEAPPRITFDADGSLRMAGTDDEVHYTLDGSLPTAQSPVLAADGHMRDRPRPETFIHQPTSLQWRHPLGAFPEGVTVRACTVDATGRPGQVATLSLPPSASHTLPIVALTVPQGAFFDQDTGIYVVGNAVFHADEDFARSYLHDWKWWKYPGNFHFRGKVAERMGHAEFFAADGTREAASDVKIRINGNNTRGFPEHALRLAFPGRIDALGFGAKEGKGRGSALLRTSGNDQDRTFFRDALQHRLCATMPFETSAYRPVVVYLNGAYWGIHNLRERLDAEEIARRHDLKTKKVTILADRLVLYDGDKHEVKHFGKFLGKAEHWDAASPWFVDSLERSMDVDDFLSYMAAQLILANVDWPDQNVKWWRWTGEPDTANGPRDGRWRWIMGDSDMGFGQVMPAEVDMFNHLARHPDAPTTRLFNACMRSAGIRTRFASIYENMLNGPLSTERMVATVGAMRDAIAPEMAMHIRRWRRPLTMAAWQQHVAAMLTFARDRNALARAHLRSFLAESPVH